MRPGWLHRQLVGAKATVDSLPGFLKEGVVREVGMEERHELVDLGASLVEAGVKATLGRVAEELGIAGDSGLKEVLGQIRYMKELIHRMSLPGLAEQSLGKYPIVDHRSKHIQEVGRGGKARESEGEEGKGGV